MEGGEDARCVIAESAVASLAPVSIFRLADVGLGGASSVGEPAAGKCTEFVALPARLRDESPSEMYEDSDEDVAAENNCVAVGTW